MPTINSDYNHGVHVSPVTVMEVTFTAHMDEDSYSHAEVHYTITTPDGIETPKAIEYLIEDICYALEALQTVKDLTLHTRFPHLKET